MYYTGCTINIANFKKHLITRKTICIIFISSNTKFLHMNILLYLSFHFFLFERCWKWPPASCRQISALVRKLTVTLNRVSRGISLAKFSTNSLSWFKNLGRSSQTSFSATPRKKSPMNLNQSSLGAKESRSFGWQLCPETCPSGKRVRHWLYWP